MLKLYCFSSLIILLCRVDRGNWNSFYFNTFIKYFFIIVISAFYKQFYPIFAFRTFFECNL